MEWSKGNVDPLAETDADADGVWGWVDNYCASYPTVTLKNAMLVFVTAALAQSEERQRR